MKHRSLVPDIPDDDPDSWERVASKNLARCPQAVTYTDDEVTLFMAIVTAFERCPFKDLLRSLANARIYIPPRLYYDRYWMSRYLLHRWDDLAHRERLLSAFQIGDRKAIKRMVRRKEPSEFLRMMGSQGVFGTVQLMQALGLAHLLPDVLALMSEDDRRRFRAYYTVGRVTMYRIITEEPIWESQPTLQEQRAMIRRIRRRDLQLRTLRRSVHQLTVQRKMLVRRRRETEQAAESLLATYAGELQRLRQELAHAEEVHSAAVAELAQAAHAELDQLRALLQDAQNDFAAALQERNRWAPTATLGGRLVAIVGDEGRESGYRSLVESAGGRFVQVSGIEKRNRVREAVADADIIILMTAHMKHAAEHVARKVAKPSALVLRCARTGLATVERTLQLEAVPRLIRNQAAAASEGGR